MVFPPMTSIRKAAEMLCVIDPDWKRSSTVKRGITAMLHSYYEILQEKNKQKQLTSHSFSMSSEPRPGPGSSAAK